MSRHWSSQNENYLHFLHVQYVYIKCIVTKFDTETSLRETKLNLICAPIDIAKIETSCPI